MKKILSNYIYYLQLLCVAAVFIFMWACQDDKAEPPVITGVVNYAASPNDTAVHTIQTGQWVVLLGRNLSGVTQVYFGSIPATINTTYFTDKSIVVQLPSIPFETVPADELNIVTAISEGGIATYDINITGEPIISCVRNYDDAPNDTVVNVLYPGDEINIVGYNLENATSISFQGILADLTNIVYTDTSAIVQVPANLSGSDASKSNTITYTTKVGEGTFAIKIVGPPVISNVSYEIPKVGDTVHLYGYNFTSIRSLTFAGTPITEYEVSADESTVSFVAPALTQSGPVEMTTPAGSFTTAYNVNDVDFINAGGVGILGNMEWGDYFGWPWWGGNVTLTSSDPNSGWPSYNADFGVGLGMYLQYKSDILDGGAGDDGNAIRMNDAKDGWVPAANLNDPGTSWAIKFEINVAKSWNGGTLCIKSSNGDYIARYEPWRISSSKAISYTTQGWQTVTIPLSEFRKSDPTLGEGKGVSITTVSELLDPASKNGGLILYIHNYGTTATKTAFDAAFDNFRVTRR